MCSAWNASFDIGHVEEAIQFTSGVVSLMCNLDPMRFAFQVHFIENTLVSIKRVARTCG